MNKIIWSEDFSVGNEVLDIDHQKIISLINQLIDYYNSSTLSPNITDILYEIISYSYHHNEFEETLLEELNYPELSHLKDEHLKFNEKIIEITIQVSNIDDKIPDKLLIFLRDWWVEHILEEDMKYKSFLEGKLNSM